VTTDLDGDSRIYSIVDGNIFQTFSLDSLSGQLKIENSDSLDYEKIPFFSLLVSVSDSSSTVTETVVINLIDLDEGPNQQLQQKFGTQIIVNINSIYSTEFVNIKSVFLPLLGIERYLKS
jgi:hypothetical protein